MATGFFTSASKRCAFLLLAPLACIWLPLAAAQVPDAPAPATAAIPYTLSPSVLATPKDLVFDVASIKPSDPNDPNGRRPHSNVPLTAGERYSTDLAYFSAHGYTLERYVAFAYDMDPNPDPQLKTLPDWANSQRWDIEARASRPVSKNEMRAMMRNLLAARFQLRPHFKVGSMPVYTLTMAKPGVFGPQMRPHRDEDMPCDPISAAPAGNGAGAGRAGGRGRGPRATPDGYPAGCGELLSLTPTFPGRWRLGGRNITMDLFVVTLRGGMDRPVIDLTGLTGRYDWVLEYVPDGATDGAAGASFASRQGDPTGPRMWTALPQQLGLKLSATRMKVHLLVFDHIARPTIN